MKIITVVLFAIICACGANTTSNSNVETGLLSNNTDSTSNSIDDVISGIVFFSTDNGATWENKSNGLPKDIFLTDIAISNNELVVSTKQHGLFRYDLSAKSWKKIATSSIKENIDAIIYYHDKLFGGTQGGSAYVSANNGISWSALDDGLTGKTIRKFAVINDRLFAGTGAGIFYLEEASNKWVLSFGQPGLQVNGITEMGDNLYIGTNKGVYTTTINTQNWEQIFPGRSLHNISSANGILYALAYNELFSSADKGLTWQSAQRGIPDGKYSFQLLEANHAILVGQWDGIYKNDPIKNWVHSDAGLPKNIAITEMKIFGDIVVAASSQWPKNEN